ncbi:MAG: SUMF1/EgtB/PvdO family nonheme iron enzyme [Anaerolineae bacterium]
MRHSEDFADLIREFLEGRVDKQVADCMAELLGGFHRSTLARWKAGTTERPRLEAVHAFATCRGLTPDDRNRLLRAAGYPVEGEAGPDPVSRPRLDDYHRRVRQDHANIELIGFYEEHRRPVILPLDRVFVSLKLTGGEREKERHGGPGLGQPEPEPKPFERALVETMQAGKHLVIVGGAGSGKTTFLRYAACALAQAHLKHNPHLAEARIGLSGYIPIFLRLRDVFPTLTASGCDDQPDVNWDDLIKAMAKSFHSKPADSRLDVDFFETLVTRRRHPCLILLDGLDEVVTPPEVGSGPAARREAVAEAIRALVEPDWNNVLIVTSRTDSYRGQAVLGEPFLRWDVEPVTEEQRQELAKKWCEEVYGDAAEDVLGSLLDGLDTMEQRDPRLVETPLLITLVALVWREHQERLPERRWKIFHAGLDALLDLRKRDASGRVLRRAQQRMKSHLPAIAFRMLRLGNPPVAKEQILDWLMEGGATTPALQDELEEGLEILGDRGGLLVQSWDHYEFGIRSFQEYLAAWELQQRWSRAVADQEQRMDLLEPLYRDPDWFEVLQLCAERLGPTSNAVQFANDLRRLAEPRERRMGFQPPAPPGPEDVEAEARALYLAGLALWEVRRRSDEEMSERTWKEFASAWDELIKQTWPAVRRDHPRASASARVDAAGVLGRVGWSPDMEFELVPAGPFPMGTSEKEVEWLLEHESDWAERWKEEGWFDWEQPQHEVDVPEFLIARFPVTFRQFRNFVDSNGYEKPDYWTDAGWEWVQHPEEVLGWSKEEGYDIRPGDGPIRRPRWWPSGWDNRPVVGVSWYEASAFCNWLDQALRKAKAEDLSEELQRVRRQLDQGWVIRLPTEVEWEKAASWDWEAQYKRRYPWGDEWDPDRCNSEESQLGAPTPVGIYPHGVAACGAEEMAGNVWEWCHTQWGEDEWTPQFGYPYQQDEREDPKGTALRVLRGGSWSPHLRPLRCADRNRLIPFIRHYVVGVRVVCAPICSEF